MHLPTRGNPVLTALLRRLESISLGLPECPESRSVNRPGTQMPGQREEFRGVLIELLLRKFSSEKKSSRRQIHFHFINKEMQI